MKKKLVLCGIFLLILLAFSIVESYGLFETNGNATSEISVGKWEITLNDYDVKLNETISLSDFTYQSNSHIEEGYLAPGNSAIFDIELDASNTDVSVNYNFVIDDSVLDDHPNISLTITDIGTNQNININNFSGVIGISDVSRVKNFRVSLNWNNSNQYDENDSLLIGATLDFDIQANFSQYIGE